MQQYLAENPSLKYIFFGGKGGVGKTVMAGTAAAVVRRTGQEDPAGLHQPGALASAACSARMSSASRRR